MNPLMHSIYNVKICEKNVFTTTKVHNQYRKSLRTQPVGFRPQALPAFRYEPQQYQPIGDLRPGADYAAIGHNNRGGTGNVHVETT